MATTLYATMLTTPASVETIQRYLYSPTEVVEAAPIVEYKEDGSRETGRLVFLILRTESLHNTANLQQQQCDRLASGLHTMTVGFQSREEARFHAISRATDNDWGLRDFAPFALASVTA